ncbi:hypothetical protein HDU98_006571 [Podochytrium sp. JEL0797]|nr:hypothetical protein HDU98_006571 [Podochytrium sp. JEL0797]
MLTTAFLYEPRTIENDINFPIYYFVNMPIFVVGLVLNGTMLFKLRDLAGRPIGIPSGIIVAIFIATPSFDTISPAFEPANTIWSLTVLFTFVGMSIAIVWLYCCSYWKCSTIILQAITNSIPSPEIDSFSTRIQREILISSILMASGLFVTYIPEFGFYLAVRVLKLNLSDQASFVWQSLARVMVTLDVLLAPALILYFFPEIRRDVFGKGGGAKVGSFITKEEK